MRCWIMSGKRWGDTDERRWEVEWYHDPPRNECGDADIDMAPCFVRHFTTRNAAMRYARKVAADPRIWGAVSVCELALERVEGNTYDWETRGQVEYVEAE